MSTIKEGGTSFQISENDLSGLAPEIKIGLKMAGVDMTYTPSILQNPNLARIVANSLASAITRAEIRWDRSFSQGTSVGKLSSDDLYSAFVTMRLIENLALPARKIIKTVIFEDRIALRQLFASTGEPAGRLFLFDDIPSYYKEPGEFPDFTAISYAKKVLEIINSNFPESPKDKPTPPAATNLKSPS